MLRQQPNRLSIAIITGILLLCIGSVYSATPAAPAAGTETARDTAYVKQWQQERLVIERQISELSRVASSQLSDPNSPASRRVTDLRDRLSAIDLKIKVLEWNALPIDSLLAMETNFRKEKEAVNEQYRATWKAYIGKAEQFLINWNKDPSFQALRGKKEANADLLAQVTLRLAELYAIQAVDTFGLLQEKWLASGAPASMEPKLDFGKAEQMYRTVLTEYPNSQWASDALYSLAYIRGEEGEQLEQPALASQKREESKSKYQTLLNDYADSKYREDAMFALGKYWLVTPPKGIPIKQQLDSAQHYFSQILLTPESKRSKDALYMLGWTAFRRPDYPTALDYFVRTINFDYERVATEDTIGSARFNQDAIAYMAEIFSEPVRTWDGAGVAKAIEFVGSDTIKLERFGIKMLELIGDRNQKVLNEYDSAIYVWKGAITLAPMHARAPFIQQKIVESALNDKHDMNLWFAEGKTQFTNYRIESDWWKSNRKLSLRKEVKPIVRDTYNRVVAYAVDRSINKDRPDFNPKMAEEAALVSAEYVKAFPSDSMAYEWNFQLANLLANTPNKSEAAYAEYKNVVGNKLYTKYKQPAAQQMLAVADEMATNDEKTRPFTPFGSDTTTGLPVATVDSLTPGEMLLANAANEYATMFSDDKSISPAYLYKAGRINYQRGQIAAANSFFDQIITKYPQTKVTERAYQLYVEGYLVQRDFANAERLTKEIQTSSVSDTLKRFAQERRAAAIFSSATIASNTADVAVADTAATEQSKTDRKAQFEKAGDDYVRVVTEIPDFKDADMALENAAVSYRKAEKPEKEIDAYMMLAQRFPSSKRTPRALFNAGLIYQNELKKPLDAAKTFDRLVTSYPEGEHDVKQAMINASYNFEAAQDYADAVRINQRFADKYTGDEVATALLFKSAALYLKMGDVAAANRIYDDFSRKYPDHPNAILANYERGKYAQEHGDLAQAKNEYSAAVNRHSTLVKAGKPGNPEYASKSLAQLVTWDLDKYKAIQYSWLDKSAEGATERKEKAKQHDAIYEQIKTLVEFGQPEQFAALYWAGEVEENLGTTYLNQKMPKITKPEDEFFKRRDVIYSTIQIYVKAVNEYASSLKRFEQTIKALEEFQASRASARDALQSWIDANTISAPAGLSDSTTVLDGIKKGIGRLDAALTEARRWQSATREKAPELANRAASLKAEIFRMALALPDAAVPRLDPLVGRALYRQQVLRDVVGPSTKDLFDDYLAAIQVARDAGFEEKWAVPARESMRNALDTMMQAASELNNRWFTVFEKDHNALQELLPKGPNGRDRLNRDVLYYTAEMMQVIEFYGGEKGVSSLMNILMDSLFVKIAKDAPGIPTLQPAIDQVVTWYLRESDRAEQFFNVAKTAEATAREKAKETNEQQYTDAFTGYETVKLTFQQQNRDLLTSIYDLAERNGLKSAQMQPVLQKLAVIDPETYGPKIGLQLTENWIGSDDSWIGIDHPVDNFQEPNLDVSNWKYVDAVSQIDAPLDSFTVAKAIPVSTFRPGEPSKAGKHWYRKSVWIPERVTMAEVRVIAAGKVSIYVNKDFISETPEGADWKAPIIQDVSAQVKPGYNVIAFEVADSLNTGGFLVAAMKYRTVPGSVTPVLPEPPNAITIQKVGKNIEVTAPAQTPPVQETPAPAPAETPAATPPAQETPAPAPVETPAATPPAQETPAPVETPAATPPAQETPAPAPVETPAATPPAQETPAPAPVETPAATPPAQETPAPAPVETPAATPPAQETPAPAPVETPAATPPAQETPAPAPFETPAVTPPAQETPAPAPVEIPAATPPAQETPAPAPVETPAVTPPAQETPAPAPVETPAATPPAQETPAPAPVETPAATPPAQETPAPAPVETPAPVPTEPSVPVVTPEQTPPATVPVVPDTTNQAVPDTTKK